MGVLILPPVPWVGCGPCVSLHPSLASSGCTTLGRNEGPSGGYRPGYGKVGLRGGMGTQGVGVDLPPAFPACLPPAPGLTSLGCLSVPPCSHSVTDETFQNIPPPLACRCECSHQATAHVGLLKGQPAVGTWITGTRGLFQDSQPSQEGPSLPFSQLSPIWLLGWGWGSCCPQEPPESPRSTHPTPDQSHHSWPYCNPQNPWLWSPSEPTAAGPSAGHCDITEAGADAALVATGAVAQVSLTPLVGVSVSHQLPPSDC